MKPENFDSSALGTLVYSHEHGFWWFNPQPLPRQLRLADETQMALSAADMAVGRLAGVGRMLRNPSLLTRPYAVREALASARIEGTQASLADVFQAEAAQRSISLNDAALVSRHIHALECGLREVREGGVTLALLRKAHRRLFQDDPTHRHTGEFREQPVWLGAATDRPDSAVFVPPIGVTMTEALRDWAQYIANPPRIPLLVRIGLLHYQFLTIHPFLDGNGRIGRMLVQFLLESERRLPAPLLYVSAYFSENRRQYYDRLQAVRERGELQAWLQFFLTAVAVQAEDGVERAERLLDLRESYRAQLAGTRSRGTDLVEMLFTNPVTTTAVVRQALSLSTQGALNLIRSLEARGWLQPLGHFGRGGASFWVAPEILTCLQAPLPGLNSSVVPGSDPETVQTLSK